MHVTIVRPPVLMPAFNMADLVVPPIGPAYVAAAIRAAGHSVKVVDAVGAAIECFSPCRGGLLHGLPIADVVAGVPAETDVIGVSVHFSFEWPVCRELLRALRVRCPQALLMVGGEHVTAMPRECFDETDIDVAVFGEGERTAVRVVDAWASGGRKAMASVDGIMFRDDDRKVAQTAPPRREPALESIPRPAWDLLPVEEYLSRGYGFGVNRGRSMPVLASRGCPYQCTFCSSPAMWTTKWSARNIDDLLDEIAALQRTYGVANFDFYDLTMIVKRQWIIDFCRGIEARGMSFLWQLPSGTRSEAIDEEVAALLFATGCRNISYAPESGSVETLEKIKKRVDLERMLRSMRSAVRVGLNVKANLIFGFPHETRRHLLDSLWFVIRCAICGIHDISIWVFVPYPGSELFSQLVARGRINTSTDEYFYSLAAYADVTAAESYSPDLSRGTLLVSRVFGLLLFYSIAWTLRPWRVVQFVCNAATGRTQSRSEMVIRGLVRRLLLLISLRGRFRPQPNASN